MSKAKIDSAERYACTSAIGALACILLWLVHPFVLTTAGRGRPTLTQPPNAVLIPNSSCFVSFRLAMLRSSASLARVEPHPLLTEHYTQPEKKPEFVDRLFDEGAKHYDSVVDWGFLGSGSWYRRWAQKRHGLQTGMRVLDVACGTGLIAVEAAKILGPNADIVCIDPSRGMLEEAKKKLKATFIQGRAESLPFPDNSFDFLTMGFALRHVSDLELTFREYRRVLKPGGKVLILEVSKPASRFGRFFFTVYFGRIYPWLTQLFTRSRSARDMMHYYWQTMDACVPPDQVLQAMQTAGLGSARRRALSGIFSEYSAVKR
jgi:demethylmenaquinone methyltransferase/2-methoxy-6-polyprenyl-1,4-benzoquinol methylase